MVPVRHALLFVLALCSGANVCAQSLQDTIRLKEAEVVATRQALFGAGQKMQQVDSATLQRYRVLSLGDLLTNETPVFVKNYGPGSLATTSFRGGSANHTAVLWNGFNLNSPMNGMLDLSLVPMFAADEVAVQYGGSSALWGSGAVGGTIQLNTRAAFNEGFTADAGVGFGSFGDARQQGRLRFGNARWAGSVGVYNAEARNDFRYVNSERTGRPEEVQSNAEFSRQGAIAEAHGRIGAHQRLSLRYWGQESDRRIPPTLLQEQSTARQADASHRFTGEWQHTGERMLWMARAAWFDELLDWYGWEGAEVAASHSQTAIAEAEARRHWGKGHALNVGVNNTWARATSDGYPDGPEQNRAAVYAAYTYTRGERWNTSLALRQEVIDGDAVPFTAQWGAERGLWKGLSLKVNAAKVYRVPTLNDMFWRPGGNPDLRPESGYSTDLGMAWKSAHGRFTWRSEVTGFSRLVDDWIIWLPGPAYWSPRNVQQVWSRGVESDSEVRLRLGATEILLGLITNHVVATNRKATSVNDASVDKQLIYVPMYSGGARAGLQWKGLTASLSAHYTGYRYIATDNSDFLDPFTLLNAALGYRFAKGSRSTWSVFASGNNLLATEYQVMLNRPMPLRNFQAGISLRFHEPLNARDPR